MPTTGQKIQNILEREATLTVLKDYIKNKLIRNLYDWISSMQQELHIAHNETHSLAAVKQEVKLFGE